MELNRNESNPTLATFDPGNICNLACSTCTETHSTRWQALKNLPIESHAFNQTVDDLDFTGIEHIVIGGGEPILHKSTHAVLEKLKHTNMRILIHFNGTVKPSLDFLNLCSYYNDMTICFSIDGVEKHFEYLRWPGRWTKVDSNIKWIVQHAPANINFAVNITISELNRTTHTLVVDWAKTVLPNNHRITFQETNTEMSLNYFDGIDQIRGTDWRKAFA
jgi:MoaA/NifB/PqqE/SkfB family radical SAM enzyme